MRYKSCDGVYHPEPLSEHCSEVLAAPPGHFWITTPDADGVRYIHMKLPTNRDEGAYCAVPIRQTGAGTFTVAGTNYPVWGWDGNLECPTLTPSIFHDFSEPNSSVAWHGFLRAGRFEGC